MTKQTTIATTWANAVAIAAIASAASVASAAPIPLYDSGGFTQARFAGNATLEGQDTLGGGPWLRTSGNPAGPAVVQPTVGVGGGYGVQFDTSPGQVDTQYVVKKPSLPTLTHPGVLIEWDQRRSTPTTGITFGPYFGVEAFDESTTPAAPKQLGGFGIDSATGDLLVLIDEGSGPAYAPLLSPVVVPSGSYSALKMLLDYASKTYTVYLGGTALETNPFVDTTAMAFTDAGLASRFVSSGGQNSLNSGVAFYDNFVITLVPEPAGLTAASLVMVGLLGRRR